MLEFLCFYSHRLASIRCFMVYEPCDYSTFGPSSTFSLNTLALSASRARCLIFGHILWPSATKNLLKNFKDPICAASGDGMRLEI